MKVSTALQWFAASSFTSAAAASLFSFGKNNDGGEVHRTLQDEDGDIVIQIDGQDVAMPLSSQVSNEDGQDEKMKRPIYLSGGGTEITLKGNMHRAVPFPTPIEIGYSSMLDFDFTVTKRTEIHGICMGTELGIDASKCYVLAGWQHLGALWERRQPQTGEGQTNHYTIPLAKLAGNETYSYLVFMQDNDGSNREWGESTFKNIEINHGEESPIRLEIDGVNYTVPLNDQRSYDGHEDEYMKRPLLVTEDGNKVTLSGNMHRAIPLPVPVKIGYASTLELDFTLTDLEEAQAICLDDYLGFDARKCFVFAGTQSNHHDWERVQPQAVVGETRHYVIPLGRLWGESEYNWMVFMQDNDSSDRNTGGCSFSNIKLHVGQEYPVSIQIDGEELVIPLGSQQSYDRGQDENMKRPLIIGDEGRSITLTGNTWRALPIPTTTIGNEATLDFDFTLDELEETHAICLEDDLAFTDRYCYVLAGTQSLHSNWERVSPQATVGNTTHYSIRLNKLSWGNGVEYKWLAFGQDNDKSNRDTGRSTFANIELNHGNELLIEDDNGNITTYSSRQINYAYQDTTTSRFEFPDDGRSVRLQGNTWRTIPLDKNISLDLNTNIDFDFTLTEEKEIHAICLTYNGGWEWYPVCLISAGTEWFGIPTNIWPRTQAGETRHYTVPVGLYTPGKTINSLSFMLDNDSSNRTTGDSTWSNIKFSQVERPKLSIQVYGQTMEIDSRTVAAADWHHDTMTHNLEYPDSTTVTLKGNMYKALNFTEPIEITASTDLAFDFTLTTEQEHHSICIVTDTDRRSFWHRYYCFTAAGTQGWGNDVDLSPKTQAGQTRHYHYPIGLKVPAGSAHYLVFIQDNDSGDRSTGESSFSNIEITERPPLNLKIEGAENSLVNAQFSYGHNQDTTDHIMEVSPSGDKISFSGNLWKAFSFGTPLTITDDTLLTFTLEVEENPEILAICFDEDREYSNSETRCIKFAGDQNDNLGPIVYRGIEQTDVTEVYSYAIKLSEYFSGDMNYIAFIHDEDRGDKTGGITHISNLQVFEQPASCLTDKSFNFQFSECTAENFVEQIGLKMTQNGCGSVNAWSELMRMFGVKSDAEVRTRIEMICKSAYDGGVDFNDMMSHEKQFVNEFFDGGNIWNYEVDEAGGANLDRDSARIGVISDKYSKSNVDFPDVHNFEGCSLRAAMCCYPAKRSGGSRGDADDNSDACYMDFSKARQSSHVRDGYSIYSGSGNEGGLHCHGFAWGNDYGYQGAAFKGNTLFEVAMVKGLAGSGHVGHLPGAPMCGCVENMPVVTRADCTRTTASQTVTVNYSPAEQFVASANIGSITHSDCGDLSTYYETLVQSGEATPNEKARLDKHLVGDCTPALTEFLGTKGFAFS